MTIKEYNELSPGDKREVHKDLFIAIACFFGCTILFAAVAFLTDYLSNF